MLAHRDILFIELALPIFLGLQDRHLPGVLELRLPLAQPQDASP